MIGILITIAILAIGGIFIWVKFVQPHLSGRYAELVAEAQKDYEENATQIKEEAFSNPDKFGAFKTIIPENEKIIAIASFLEPKSIGKNLLGETKTLLTNIKKVNMSLFYIILTDENLHAVAYNGKNTVSHDIFDLNEIKDMVIEKSASAKNALKNALSGVEGYYDKMIFAYKDQKHTYNLKLVVEGFPIFDVHKDTVNNTFYRTYKASSAQEATDNKKKEYYIDNTLRSSLYREFQKAISERYHVEFPTY